MTFLDKNTEGDSEADPLTDEDQWERSKFVCLYSGRDIPFIQIE